jgi:hypothetical protein
MPGEGGHKALHHLGNAPAAPNPSGQPIRRGIGFLSAVRVHKVGELTIPRLSSHSPTVKSHLPIDHVRRVAPLAEELHHFLARPCHLTLHQTAPRNYCVLFSRMAETGGGSRGCDLDSALGRGMR